MCLELIDAALRQARVRGLIDKQDGSSFEPVHVLPKTYATAALQRTAKMARNVL